MHNRYTKRGSHRRLLKEDVIEEEKRDLTGPVTLTVTLVHGPDNTPIATFSDDGDYQEAPTILPPPLSQTTVVPSPPPAIPSVSVSKPVQTPVLSSIATTSPTSVSGLPTSTTIPSPIISASASAASSTSVASSSSSGTPSSADNTDDGEATVQLSSGAIAGIVIGCLIVLLAAVVFGFRKRTIKNRLRLRGMWTGSKNLRLGRGGSDSAGLEATPYTYRPPGDAGVEAQRGFGTMSQGSMSFVGGHPATFAGAGANTNMRSPASPRSMSTLGLELPQGLPSAYGYGYGYGVGNGVGSAGSMLSPSRKNTAVVVRSFVPSLPDELSISTGEMLEIVQEFDDGWAECMNRSGEKGMVPLECFDPPTSGGRMMANSPVEGAVQVTREEGSRSSRRLTSLPSARR